MPVSIESDRVDNAVNSCNLLGTWAPGIWILIGETGTRKNVSHTSVNVTVAVLIRGPIYSEPVRQPWQQPPTGYGTF